jgi:hypothetical protein
VSIYPDPIPGSPGDLSPAEQALLDAALLRLAEGAEFPHELVFAMDGDTFALTGSNVWVCEFSAFTILAVRAALGRGYSPTNQPVIIDVNKGSGATPVFTSIFAADADRPRIPVGLQVGPRVTPTAMTADATPMPLGELVQGDCLTIDVDQADTAEPPTDQDLTVSIFGIVHG